MLAGRRIVLGISGSIACYKAAHLASRLTQAGAVVDAVLTPAATRFITPLALRSLTRRPVYVDMFDPASELAEQHVELARCADVVLVAPATASTIAHLAHGLADDLLSLTVLATRAPILVAPAMDSQMWTNPATQANVTTLTSRGIAFVGPVLGRLASGRVGEGRFESTENIRGALSQLLGRNGDLSGRRVVVTAGGTREPIDPVRFIGNHSSGKMGYAIAQAARDRGAAVTLISAATTLPAPYGVRFLPVQTASEMCGAVLDACRGAEVLVMAAAVADFQPDSVADQKIKKTDATALLALKPTPDILQAVARAGYGLLRVGFAAESEELVANAAEKLRRKSLDLVVANDITATDAGFNADDNRVQFLDPDGAVEALPLLPKYDVAQRLLDRVVKMLERRANSGKVTDA